jgi:hypothetical protein
VNLREERDVLVDAQIAVEREALRQVADGAGDVAMLLHGVLAEHADGPPSIDVQQSRRSRGSTSSCRAVWADQAEHLACSTLNDTPRSASTLPYRLTTFWNSMAAIHFARVASDSASTGMPCFSTPPCCRR